MADKAVIVSIRYIAGPSTQRSSKCYRADERFLSAISRDHQRNRGATSTGVTSKRPSFYPLYRGTINATHRCGYCARAALVSIRYIAGPSTQHGVYRRTRQRRDPYVFLSAISRDHQRNAPCTALRYRG